MTRIFNFNVESILFYGSETNKEDQRPTPDLHQPWARVHLRGAVAMEEL